MVANHKPEIFLVSSEEWMAMIVGLSEGATAALFESAKRDLENEWRLRERRRMIRLGSW
jgi:hypothetical protein